MGHEYRLEALAKGHVCMGSDAKIYLAMLLDNVYFLFARLIASLVNVLKF